MGSIGIFCDSRAEDSQWIDDVYDDDEDEDEDEEDRYANTTNAIKILSHFTSKLYMFKL